MAEAYLYLCDGKACNDISKTYCHLNNGECRHTSNIEHALYLNNKTVDTTFVRFNPEDDKNPIYFEELVTKQE